VCEQAKMECVIIDSASAFWMDALETQGKIAERTKSSFSAWKPVKNDQQKMMQAILQCKMHVISNYRAKIEYTQDVENGKKVVKSLGMGIIAEGNTSYEYTVMFMLDDKHEANATKDRTGIFDGQYFVITADTGRKLYQWMAEGEVQVQPPVLHQASPAPAPTTPADQLQNAINVTTNLISQKLAENPARQEAIIAATVEVIGDQNFQTCQDMNKLRELYNRIQTL